jgi:hypothetical protein
VYASSLRFAENPAAAHNPSACVASRQAIPVRERKPDPAGTFARQGTPGFTGRADALIQQKNLCDYGRDVVRRRSSGSRSVLAVPSVLDVVAVRYCRIMRANSTTIWCL